MAPAFTGTKLISVAETRQSATQTLLFFSISYSLEKKNTTPACFLTFHMPLIGLGIKDYYTYKLKRFFLLTYFLVIKSYPTDRHFQINFGTFFSNIANINAGVLQYVMLSLILYNLSGKPIFLSNIVVAEFSDDKAIILLYKDPHNVSSNLQNHLVYLMFIL